MNDASDGFYQVYQAVFQRIHQYDVESEHGLDLPNPPSFGRSITVSEYELTAFYNFWQNFVSILSFSWVDKVNPSDAPCREVRRMVEKENKKEREKERKVYIEQVREVSIIMCTSSYSGYSYYLSNNNKYLLITPKIHYWLKYVFCVCMCV